MHFPRFVLFLVCLSLNAFCLFAQSPNGNINGLVSDPSRAAVVGAEIVAVNDVTGVQYTTKTNDEGIYVLPNLPPGPYRVQVSKIGFKTLVKPDIVLNVQDSLSINFTLLVGAFHEIVTVEGGAPMVNTESAAVSTVVDRRYVENMPLNGRSFQDLILLTPGVVTNTPQSAANIGVSGEFSVNGQRTESNSYLVDGISANLGAPAGQTFVPSLGGALPVSTALGTTQALVSVDALQEFRVQTSTYSAEYGRTPGGVFSFATRSGTNQLHGTAFEYLRNDAFDANDWFNDFFGTPKSALRQNDFGGTLGGPIRIPRLYEKEDRTFFFFSYEGLRLLQPQAATVNYVPDATLRASAPTALQQVLNAFPVSNCTSSTPNCATLGNGLAGFVGSWSNPSRIDAWSLRLDHVISDRARLFFRFSDTPSSTSSRPIGSFASPGDIFKSKYSSQTYSFGVTGLLSNRVSNELRIGYATNTADRTLGVDGFGGGQVVDLAQLQGMDTRLNPAYSVSVTLDFPAFSPSIGQYHQSGSQNQWNLVDFVSVARGRHQIKLGVDYRRSAPVARPFSPNILYFYSDDSAVQTNDGLAVSLASGAAYPLYRNFSAFVQDEWRVTSRLALSMGLRWEVNPAPTSSHGKANLPYTVRGDTLAGLVLAPQGTSLWNTTWYNFAPRLGIAYVLRNSPSFETVVRGGSGVFFDTGQQDGSEGYSGIGFSAITFLPGSVFPMPFAQVNPVIVNPPQLPYTGSPVYAFPPHLQLPYTIGWNTTLEQSLGSSQVFRASYVGAHAQRLLQATELNINSVNPNFGTVLFYRNGLSSDYNALQLQLQRRLSSGLQALASYTWGHSIDYGSFDASLPYERGNSDNDVRHSVSGALSFDLPTAAKGSLARGMLSGWGIDGRFTARTGFPITLNGGSPILDPSTGRYYYAGLDLVQGVPLYLHGSQYPGGRSINPGAFASPQSAVGNAPRNFVNGFGAWQLDLAMRRNFAITDLWKLQFRAEAFNLLNHPNFGTINSTFCTAQPGCTFGQATQTLAQSLGVLSPLYQMGGPRSLQLSLKLTF